MEDLFIREHIEDLLRNIRTQVLIKLIRPYTRVRIDFVSLVSDLRSVLKSFTSSSSFSIHQELNVDATEVESLLVATILDGTINGRIDQVNQILELDQESQGNARYPEPFSNLSPSSHSPPFSPSRYGSLDQWSSHLDSLHAVVVGKMV